MTKLRYCTTERQVTSGKEHMHLILKTKECKHKIFLKGNYKNKTAYVGPKCKTKLDTKGKRWTKKSQFV